MRRTFWDVLHTEGPSARQIHCNYMGLLTSQCWFLDRQQDAGLPSLSPRGLSIKNSEFQAAIEPYLLLKHRNPTSLPVHGSELGSRQVLPLRTDEAKGRLSPLWWHSYFHCTMQTPSIVLPCAKQGHLSVSPSCLLLHRIVTHLKKDRFCHPLFLCHHHRHLQSGIYHLFFLGLS